jgi:hypothetical protein
MESPGSQSPVDGVIAHPSIDKLRAGDDAVLAFGKRRNLLVPSVR